MQTKNEKVVLMGVYLCGLCVGGITSIIISLSI